MTAPLRALVVDDDFRVAELHRTVVEQTPGFVALAPARSLATARETILRERPDLLLVDLFLPDGEGVSLARDHDLDAIVLSGATDTGSVRHALRAGALSYLVKPFDARTLRDRLERYARMRNVLASAVLTQDEIDRALGILHGDAATTTRSATEQLVLGALGDGEASAGEVADACGVSRATAQRHLASLATRGVVEVRLRYGVTGRPEHRYAVARG